jgi:DedD protein
MPEPEAPARRRRPTPPVPAPATPPPSRPSAPPRPACAGPLHRRQARRPSPRAEASEAEPPRPTAEGCAHPRANEEVRPRRAPRPRGRRAARRPDAKAGRFVVQVGAYTDPTRCATPGQGREAGLKTYTQVGRHEAGKRTRVRVGPFATRPSRGRQRKLKAPACRQPAGAVMPELPGSTGRCWRCWRCRWSSAWCAASSSR